MVYPRTYGDWIDSKFDDEKEGLSLSDAYRAGAEAMLEFLIADGFVEDNVPGDDRADRARSAASALLERPDW